MFVRSTQILCPCRLFTVITESYSIVWLYCKLFTHSLVMGMWVVGDGHLSSFQFGTIRKRAAILKHACIYYILLCTKPQQQTSNAVLFPMVLWVGLVVSLQALSGITLLPYSVGLEGSRWPPSHVAAGVGCQLRYLSSLSHGSPSPAGWAGFLTWQSQGSVPRGWREKLQDILRSQLWNWHTVMSTAWPTQIQEIVI